MPRSLALVLAALLFLGASAKAPREPRIPAEWEPAVGTMIVWPLKLPPELVKRLAAEETLYVLVAYDDQEQHARRTFAGWGIDSDHVQFIRTSVESEWTRDYGAHQVFDRAGNLTVVDPIYIDTPLFPAERPPVKRGDELRYFRRYPGDDRTNLDVAEFFEFPLRSMAAHPTGGNFLVDGHGTAFMTRAMVDENNTRMSDSEFFALVKELTGVRACHVLDNTEKLGIQHIDCWLKLLDEETLLVKRAPTDHPEHARVERNLGRLRQLMTCYGRHYEIVRVDCPVYGTEPDPDTKDSQPALAAYTNSLILNRRVFVPQFGCPGDEAALATYRRALPGYQVHGIPFDGWRSNDALHCRTRAVFDRGLLFFSHARIRGEQPAGKPVPVAATIHAYSGRRLVRHALELRWRRAGESEWRTVPLARAGGPDAFQAQIPAQEAGTGMEYYLSVSDRSGRRETLPRSAPAGFYSFTVARNSTASLTSR